MMISTIKESPSANEGDKLLSRTFTVGDFNFRGFSVGIVKEDGRFFGVIQTVPFPIVHSDGTLFNHRQSVRTTSKTVIKWHLKFGGWRLPK
jgi:hypothetical protein